MGRRPAALAAGVGRVNLAPSVRLVSVLSLDVSDFMMRSLVEAP
jgi:hypothetical protein